jgi:hypothetical protein
MRPDSPRLERPISTMDFDPPGGMFLGQILPALFLPSLSSRGGKAAETRSLRVTAGADRTSVHPPVEGASCAAANPTPAGWRRGPGGYAPAQSPVLILGAPATAVGGGTVQGTGWMDEGRD